MEFVWDSQVPTQQQSDLKKTNESNSTSTYQWPQQLTISNCDNFFCFLKDYSVLVCKQHCTAVVSLDAHLRKHHAVSATLRRQIIKQFSCFETVPPSAVKNPDKPAQLIEELGKPLDGVQCKACRWITTNKDQMRITYPTGEGINGRENHFCQDPTKTPTLHQCLFNNNS